MRRRGFTLVQASVGSFVLVVVAGGMFSVINNFHKVQTLNTTLPAIQVDAETAAETLANDIRRASLCTSSDSGCTVDSAFANATSTSLTVYARPSSLEQRVYSAPGGSFQKVVGGTTTTFMSDVTLTLTYYQGTGYRTSSWTAFTPDSTTVKQIIGVGITVSITRNNTTASYSTIVRPRNSPKKTSTYE
ncbi:MAG: hypothetical protein JSS65_06660 [Armatimonadetes bacterium]|nr:hypothetical protein [Armatimonadota bacterium]